MYRSILNLLLFFKPKIEMIPTPEMVALQSLTAQSPLYDPDLTWIPIEDLKPVYDTPILIWDGKITHRNWIRLSDGLFGDDTYINSDNNQIMFEDDIVLWAYPPKPKIEPNKPPFYTQSFGQEGRLNKHDEWTIINGDVYVKINDYTYTRVTANGIISIK